MRHKFGTLAAASDSGKRVKPPERGQSYRKLGPRRRGNTRIHGTVRPLVARVWARSSARVGAVAAASTLALATAGGSGADPSGAAARASQLRSQNASLATRAQRAVLDLYSIESELTRARARVAGLQTETTRVRAERALVRHELTITHHVLRVSQRLLAERLRTLYEQGDVDPLAVLLGSTSLDQALTSLAAIQRVSAQSENIIRETTATRARLGRLDGRLLARTEELEGLERDAQQAAAALDARRGERVALLASLRTRQRLNVRTIASLQATARAAESKSAELTATAAAAPAPAPDPATAVSAGGESAAAASPALEPAPAAGSLTVVATGYSIHGRTATGVPTGWGVAAVDPTVIPLGTRFDVPGYGVAVAADTGGAVRGATIDLWFPTLAQALAWGRRTVTITLH